MKKTVLTFNTLDRFEKEYNTSHYTPAQVKKIELAAYVANMNASNRPEWSENDIFADFLRVLDIDKIEVTKAETAEKPATVEQFPNIKKAIAEHEAETVRKFAADLDTKTAAEVVGSWYYKEYTTPKTLEALKAAEQGAPVPADIAEKMKAKQAKKEAKKTAERLEKLATYEQAHTLRRGSVSVEFVRSRAWGYNPHAVITGETLRTYGTASGCGYDKESAAIASAMNDNPEIMRILCEYAETGRKFPYSVRTFAGLPFVDGGCGVSCFIEVFKACGYEWRQVVNLDTVNAYTLEKI